MPENVSIVIVTYKREEVLVQTLKHLRRLNPLPNEVLVIDQTEVHQGDTQKALDEFAADGFIRIVKREPSIVKAMNHALLEAQSEIVLFLDDDVIPSTDLVAKHAETYRDPHVAGVVGQVLQPGEEPLPDWRKRERTGIYRDLDFRFCSCSPCHVANMIGCNMSVSRRKAIDAGGFDENFVFATYRFETEFARRLERNGGSVMFNPSASIRHLAAKAGGTRSFGSHLKSPSYKHSVGDYYFALLEGTLFESLLYCTRRLLTSTATRFHLKHPWYIPPKVIGEIRGLLRAVQLWRRGPKQLKTGANQ